VSSGRREQVFHIFGALAEFDWEIIRERTNAGLASARKRSRKGGPKRKLTEKEIATAKKLWESHTPVAEICQMLGVSRATFYRYVKARE